MRCKLHNFQTDDIEAWDRHCYYMGHLNRTYQIVDGKEEYVDEPYPRHHLRDAKERGDEIICEGEYDENICT